MSAVVNDAPRFLDVICKGIVNGAGLYLEFRLLQDGKKPIQTFDTLPLNGISWERMQTLNRAGWNIHFGVCPRKRKGGEKKDVCSVPALWVDVDGKDFSSGKEEALKKFDTLPPHLYPSVIVDSGNGYHAYWLLKEAETLKNEADIRRVEGYAKGLAQHLRGDHTHDVSRVMRLPGTLNMKNPSNPLPCHIVHFEPGRRFILSDFDDYWVDPGETRAKATIGDFPRELPAKFKALLPKHRLIRATWEGRRPDLQDQSGSGYDMAMADLLAGHRFTDEEIASVLVNMPSGKGKEATQAYLAHTIAKSRVSASKAKVETLGEFLASPIEPREEFLSPVLGRGDLVVLSGPAKLGKSILTLNIALALADGKSWFDFSVTTPYRILIVQQEVTRAALKDRFLKMVGVDEGYIPDLKVDTFLRRVFIRSERGIYLDRQEGRDKLCRWIEEALPDLLILDPLYTFHSKEENSASQMGQLFNLIHQLKDRYNLAGLIVHHFGKPKEVEREGGELHRGSSVIGDASDANWTFKRVPPNKYQLQGPLSEYGILSFELRNAEAPEPIILRRDSETLWYERVEPEGTAKVKAEDVKELVDQKGLSEELKDALTRADIDLSKVQAAAWQKDIEEGLQRLKGVSHNPVREAILKAKEKEVRWVKIPQQGNPVVLYLHQG